MEIYQATFNMEHPTQIDNDINLQMKIVECISRGNKIIEGSKTVLENLKRSGKLDREIQEFKSKTFEEKLQFSIEQNNLILNEISSIMEISIKSTYQEKIIHNNIDYPDSPNKNSPSNQNSILPHADKLLHQENPSPTSQSQLDNEYYLIYEGQSENGLKSGVGILRTKDGCIVYEGEWKKDKYEGKGILNNIFQKSIESPRSFEDLNQMGEAWVNYEGEFCDGLFNGYGSLKFFDEEIFEGIFHDGKATGEGIYTCVSGEQIKGVWKENYLVELFE